MKKIIIFDFDGTLADTFPTTAKIFKNTIKEYGYSDITDSDIQKLREMTPLQIITHFKFPPWKVPELINKVREKVSESAENIRPFPGIKQMLMDLKKKNIIIGIVTSNSKKTVEIFLKQNNFPDFEFVESEENIFKKAKHLKTVIKKHKFNKKDVVYVGDEVRDIEASKDSGIDVIAVTWGYNKKDILVKENPKYIANIPKEIILHTL